MQIRHRMPFNLLRREAPQLIKTFSLVASQLVRANRACDAAAGVWLYSPGTEPPVLARHLQRTKKRAKKKASSEETKTQDVFLAFLRHLASHHNRIAENTQCDSKNESSPFTQTQDKNPETTQFCKQKKKCV